MLEPLAKPGGPEGGLALVVADNWQVDLLENNLVIASSSELVLSPSCGEAALAIKELLWLWKTHSVNMSLKVKVLGSVENCPVVGEVPWVELRVDVQGLNISVLVLSGLCLVLGVPFSASDLQLGWFLLELGSTVGSSEDDSRGNQGASTLVEVHGLGFSSKARILSTSPFSCLCPHLGTCFTIGGGGGGMKSGSRQQTSRNPGHLESSGLRMPKPFLMSMRPPPSVMMVPLWHW